MNLEEAAIKIAELIESKSNFQEQIGRLVLSVQSQYGTQQTENLKELINEQGQTMSPDTLRQYAWVSKKTEELNLPPDLTFSLRRSIIRSPNLDRYLKLIKEGHTAAQIKREMAKDNKQSKTKHTGYCKACNAEVDVKGHHCQEENRAT